MGSRSNSVTMAASNNAKQTRGSPFKPGNKHGKGRLHGSRNKTTIAIEALLDGEAEALTRKAVDLALEGDMAALRLCLERICPPRKSRFIAIELPRVETAKDITAAHAVVIEAMARGDITPDEASSVAGVLDARRKSLETTEIEKRIEALELLKESRK